MSASRATTTTTTTTRALCPRARVLARVVSRDASRARVLRAGV